MDDTIPTAAPAALLPPLHERIARTAAGAAIEVDGVHRLGSPAGRAPAGAVAWTTRRDLVPGVRVATRLDGVEAMVAVVADYPVNVIDVAGRVHDAVATSLEAIGAGDVIVAVSITDVHGPYDREESSPDALPQPSARTGEQELL